MTRQRRTQYFPWETFFINIPGHTVESYNQKFSQALLGISRISWYFEVLLEKKEKTNIRATKLFKLGIMKGT